MVELLRWCSNVIAELKENKKEPMENEEGSQEVQFSRDLI